MSSTPWYAWYPSDFRGKTSRLTFSERDAYRTLLDEYYLMAEALPQALPELWRITGAQTDEERLAVEKVIHLFFVSESGRYHNKRADKELRKLAQHRASLSQRGRAGAEARWQAGDGQSNATANATANACAMATDMAYPHPHTTTTTTTTKNKDQKHSRINGKPRKLSLPASFEAFEPSERIKTYCAKRGETQLKAHMVYFVGYAKANGKQYADWDQALINAIRCDWAGIRKAGL